MLKIKRWEQFRLVTNHIDNNTKRKVLPHYGSNAWVWLPVLDDFRNWLMTEESSLLFPSIRNIPSLAA